MRRPESRSNAVARIRASPLMAERLSYAERRKQREGLRRKKEQQLHAAASKTGGETAGTNATPAAKAAEEATEDIQLTEEEVMQALKEYQAERMRQGMEPLPLSPESETDEPPARERAPLRQEEQ
jgi:hypothetical protein